jgi:putative phosphoribosyl transferase
MNFTDRTDAGCRLAERVQHLRGERVVVLGLPRGGVPVAFEVARSLGAPLDVIVVRKLGVPFQPELGMGAIGEDGVRVINDEVVELAGVSQWELAEVEAKERDELIGRARRFRGDRPRLSLEGCTALIVDDGIATGSTARAACQVARAHGASRVVLAVPVAPQDWTTRLGHDADELICLATPEPFFAVGQFYDDFSATSDDEVIACLDRARWARSWRDEEVVVPVGPVELAGHLTLPELAIGVVLFAHGSGSSRHSPRNRYVADVLHRAGIGTLLFDLLTEAEELDRALVFDVEMLAGRLVDVTRWVRAQSEITGLPVGYFGASTGAAAALLADALLSSASPDAGIAAIVSRGGRPDLAGPHLGEVRAPTLLIVGGDDDVVLELNNRARAALRCESDLVVIPGATHLFEEPGTLQAAAEAARDWLVEHLARVEGQSS